MTPLDVNWAEDSARDYRDLWDHPTAEQLADAERARAEHAGESFDATGIHDAVYDCDDEPVEPPDGLWERIITAIRSERPPMTPEDQ